MGGVNARPKKARAGARRIVTTVLLRFQADGARAIVSVETPRGSP
jgi:hypothetical protein